MLFSIYKPFSKWIDRHQTLLKNKMASTWEMNKHLIFYREAGFNPNEHPTAKILEFLQEGVDYKDKKKRYWVDREKRGCFAIYPRGLNIDNGDRNEYWRWTTDSLGIETAEVVDARWLGVRGSFQTTSLLHRVKYTVSFQLMVKPGSNMKRQMVTVILTLPGGNRQEQQVQLPEDDDQWHELKVGRFVMTPQKTGEMTFSMEQQFGGWKKGLVIKCVEIKPCDHKQLYIQ